MAGACYGHGQKERAPSMTASPPRAAETARSGNGPGRPAWRRWLPLALLVLGLALFLGLRLDQYISFAALKQHRALLMDLVDRHTALTALGFSLIYVVSVAFSLPIATVLTISAGFLFGQWLGTALVVVGATTGATAVFLAARSAFGDALRRRAGPWLAKMQEGFRANAFTYLIILRLIPLFPFVVVNLVPAALGMSLRHYVLATLLGIVPGSFVFTSVGAGLGSVFDSGAEFTAKGVLTPQIIVALVGLACLAVLPLVYKKARERRPAR